MTEDEILSVVLDRAEHISDLPQRDRERALDVLWASSKGATSICDPTLSDKEAAEVADELVEAVRTALALYETLDVPEVLH